MSKGAFSTNNFFDLGKFSHKDIFENKEFVWGPLSDLERYINYFFENKLLKANYKDEKNVFVGEGTVIEEGAKIKGPVIIGRNCTIGHGCFIRDNCLLGDNVHIGHATEIKQSIFLNNSAAAHLNYVGDSIIGSGVNISGGAILANFRLDRLPVTVRKNGEKIETNLQKFGSVIGDNSIIGVNSVLNPGTILGKNCKVYPLTILTGYYKESSTIKNS